VTKRILVTGASGFLGRAVVARIRAEGWECIRLDRRRDYSRDTEISVDYNRPELISALQTQPPCEGVVHLATHVDFSSGALIKDFFSTNVLATSLLCNKVDEWQSHIVFASGALVFGSKSLIDENTTPAPNTAYAKAKYLGEEIIRASGVPRSILRTGGIFGRHGPTHLGLNRVIDGAIDGHRRPSIVGQGLGRRNYIYVEDLAEIIFTCLAEKIYGTHLVAGRQTLSIAEMFNHVCDVFIPETKPAVAEGDEAADMIVIPSPALPVGRGFNEALRHILERSLTN